MKTLLLVLTLAMVPGTLRMAGAQEFPFNRGPTSRQIMALLARDAWQRAQHAQALGDETAAWRYLNMCSEGLRVAENIPADVPGDRIVHDLRQGGLQRWQHALASQNPAQIEQARTYLRWTENLARHYEHARITGAPFQLPPPPGPYAAAPQPVVQPPIAPPLIVPMPLPVDQRQEDENFIANGPAPGNVGFMNWLNRSMGIAERIYEGAPIMDQGDHFRVYDNGVWYRIPKISDRGVEMNRLYNEQLRRGIRHPSSSYNLMNR